MWRVSSEDGTRWVQYDDGMITSEPADLALRARSVLPVELAAMTGDFYTPKRADDPVAVFIRARTLVGRHVVTGTAPHVPAAGGYAVPGLRY